MKLSAIFAALFLLFSTCAIVMPDNADAARFGGGRSFGSKPFMSRPAPAPRQATPRQQPAAAPSQAPSKGGLFGGLAGGLLAGTLLGSWLGGHDANGAGVNGFNGGDFIVIILLAILAFIAYKLFQRFRSGQAPQPAGGANGKSIFGNSQSPFSQPFQRNDSAASAWSNLGASQGNSFQTQAHIDIPAGFDVDEFLRGAKMAYNRLQKSWDKRDLDDIAQFTTPAVLDTIKDQLAKDPESGNTEIMLVNAQLLGVEDEGQDQRAQVFFDVLMREEPNQQTPESVREVWHFLRTGKNGMWKLDGIQQVD